MRLAPVELNLYLGRSLRAGINRLHLLFYLIVVSTCIRPERSTNYELDYGLDDGVTEVKGEIPWHLLNPDHLVRDDFSRSSFPTSFIVGNPRHIFERFPAPAIKPQIAYVFRQINGCNVGVRTGIIELDSYIFTNKFVKLRSPIPGGSLQRLDPGKKAFLTFQTFLHAHLSKHQFRNCAEQLYGKTTYLGQFHLGDSKLSFLEAHQKGEIFAQREVWDGFQPARIYLRWNLETPYPEIIDHLGAAGTIQSPMFSFQTSKVGHYAVIVRTSLAPFPPLKSKLSFSWDDSG